MGSRARRLLRFLKAHRLALGFLAALAPLVVLVALQVIWLTDLDRASALAHRTVLRGSLESVGREVRHFYRSTADRLLHVPAAFFKEEDMRSIADYWKGCPHEGVRTLFAISFSESATGEFYTFEPNSKTMVMTSASEESLAIVIAAMPWQRWGDNPLQPEDPLALHVNEQNPEHRIVLEPIAGDDGDVVGLAGFVLDVDYARNVLVPRVVEATLPKLFPDEDRPELYVANGLGTPLFGHRTEQVRLHHVSASLPFVLRDWTVHVHSDGPAPHWFQGSLTHNLTLGSILALALLAGLALAMMAARDAMRLSQMKSDFVSNVSHELRTPLASIRLFAEMMTMGRVRTPEKVVEYGSYIEAETRRLSRLIENILDFSRIESEQKEYRCEPTDVLEVVQKVLKAFSVRLEQAGLRLRSTLPEAPGPTARLDEDAVGQALHNLLDNAAKYSKGAEEIEVSVMDQDGFVVISVKDHGIGIAKADQSRVFERFHRVSTGLVHDVKGSGLGLALAAHTARAHGGRVTLVSELGKGSTFSLWLPRCEEIGCEQDLDRRG